MNDNFNSTEMINVFCLEILALLKKFSEILLQYEKTTILSEGNINEIFRIMHTLRGSANMMSINGIFLLAKKAEDLLFIIRERQSLNKSNVPEFMNLMMVLSETLEEMVNDVEIRVQFVDELSEKNNKLFIELDAFHDKLK